MRRCTFILATLIATAGLPIPIGHTQAAAIQFLNPSGYTSATQPRVLSAKTDADATYHLVAWAKGLPPNPVVEFELRPAAVGGTTTVTATRVGSTSTWEYDLELASIEDGQYTLTAQLYSGESPVADDSESVTVNNDNLPPPDAANTVEILSPENGGGAGYFTPPGKSPGFVVHSMASEDTNRVRVLYSLSDTGNEPAWKQCGAATPNEDRLATVRCTMASGDSAADVGAIAAVSNRTPTGDPAPAADESGDAHQVIPYLQIPSTVRVNPATSTQDPAKCQRFTVDVADQNNRPIPGVNVDVHAVGPDDNLTFATLDTTIPGVNDTDPYQAPDRGHTTERARRCSDGAFLDNQQQGETNRPGGIDDEKHIESTSPASSLGGTDIGGNFVFALYSATGGPTQITAWADVNDDDVLGGSEASGGSQLGWGQPPPEPVVDVVVTPASTSATRGECVRISALARRGGSPLGAANVDVHISGPDSSVAFCTPPDGTASRTPDSGSHVVGAHDDGTKHLEGETSAAGQFVFGVTSSGEGTSSVTVWVDRTDDDSDAGEPRDDAQITWQTETARSISLNASRARVRKGTRVRLFGAIDGATACEAGQTVQLQSRPASGGSFTTIKTLTTDDSGGYTTRVKMRRARTFRAVAPAADPCESAQSGTVTVRVRRS